MSPGPNVASVIVRPSRVGADRASLAVARRCNTCHSRRPRGRRPGRARRRAAPRPRRCARGRRARASRRRAHARAAPRPQTSVWTPSATRYHNRAPRAGDRRLRADRGGIVSWCSRAHAPAARRPAVRTDRRRRSRRTAPAKSSEPGERCSRSRELWATIDVCSPADQPNTVGVRGSMPGDGHAGDRMYMSFRLQYLNSTTGKWSNLVAGRQPQLRGASAPPRQPARAAAASSSCPVAGQARRELRGIVDYQWRRGRACAADGGARERPRGTGASPAPIRPATARRPASSAEQPRVVGDDAVDAHRRQPLDHPRRRPRSTRRARRRRRRPLSRAPFVTTRQWAMIASKRPARSAARARARAASPGSP